MLANHFRILRYLLVLLTILVGPLNSDSPDSDFIVNTPRLSELRFHSPGDIMIGMLFTVTSSSSLDSPCDSSIRVSDAEDLMMAVNAIDLANEWILSSTGLRLGFSAIDTCNRDNFALAQVMNFLPRPNQPPYIAIICCHRSSLSAIVSPLTTAYKIPQISHVSTSDVLSDKILNKYFLRMAPPDMYQVQAIIDILLRFGWTYVSILYEQGSYGENVNQNFERLTLDAGICIAYSKKIITSGEDYAAVVSSLLKNKAARVVVAVLGLKDLQPIFGELKLQNATNYFIWIGTDSWGNVIRTVQNYNEEVGVGSLALTIKTLPRPDIFRFMERVTLNDTRNDWIRQYWEARFGCSWSNGTCNQTAIVSSSVGFKARDVATLLYDAVSTLTLGLQTYLTSINSSLSAFDNSQYLKALLNTQFEGVNGPVKFDEKGDMLGSYSILHVTLAQGAVDVEDVGTWNRVGQLLSINMSRVIWADNVPESVCSHPCNPGEIQLPRETKCCWNCFRCREYEFTNPNQSKCLPCPIYTWPDTSNYSTCEPISPNFIRLSDAVGICLMAVAGLGCLLTIATVVIFIFNNDKRLIRTSCRETSFILLFGTLLDFGSIYAYVGEPNAIRCYIIRFSFHLVCTLTYAPVMIKVVKVFRIFFSGQKSTRSPKFISPTAQLIVIGLLVLAEAGILTGSVFFIPPAASLFQRSRSERFLELSCNESVTSLAIGVAFNFCLVLACALLAFKARKLPQNFNESAQIAFCVYTTLILWMAFVPAYVTTSSSYNKQMLLALVLALNGLVALGTLFAPKIYALYFIAESKIVFNAHTNSNTLPDKNANKYTPTALTTPIPLAHSVNSATTNSISKTEESEILNERL